MPNARPKPSAAAMVVIRLRLWCMYALSPGVRASSIGCCAITRADDRKACSGRGGEDLQGFAHRGAHGEKFGLALALVQAEQHQAFDLRHHQDRALHVLLVADGGIEAADHVEDGLA